MSSGSAKDSLLQLPLGDILWPAVNGLFIDSPSITQFENISSYLPKPWLIQKTLETKGTLGIHF